MCVYTLGSAEYSAFEISNALVSNGYVAHCQIVKQKKAAPLQFWDWSLKSVSLGWNWKAGAGPHSLQRLWGKNPFVFFGLHIICLILWSNNSGYLGPTSPCLLSLVFYSSASSTISSVFHFMRTLEISLIQPDNPDWPRVLAQVSHTNKLLTWTIQPHAGIHLTRKILLLPSDTKSFRVSRLLVLIS